MDGLLLVDKPTGWTSFDVVNKVRRMAGIASVNATKRKRFPVGHTGTLDPLATGLLVLLLGVYTKRAMELTKLDKVYDVTMFLGVTSTTGDEEGEKVQQSGRQPSQAAILAALLGFIGPRMQTPPAFSAVKIQGKRAYELARQGQKPELQPRPIHIYDLKFTSYSYPYVQFTAHVSSGTYIRTLAEELGRELETGAYMSALRRTQVGEFKIEDAVSIEQIQPETLQDFLQNI